MPSGDESDSSADEAAICKVCLKACTSAGAPSVQCDRCPDWYHFECVGVDNSVQDRSWLCDPCAHDKSKSSTPSSTINLTEKQQQTNKEQTNTTGAGSSNNNKGNVSLSKSKCKGVRSGNETTKQMADNEHITGLNQHAKNSRTQLMLAMLEEEKKAHQDYIEKKYKISSEMGDSASTESIVNFRPKNELTSSQVAARQVIPKDLPNFSGDPVDWPAFISTYENSTSVAGFSDIENMLRLQKSLKGKALDLVKDKLLVPFLVPEVIETLKTFFGRPEQILERLIEKVRGMPAPKDKLESLIEYALGIRSVCATMQACKLNAHLENRMLVKELVAKLPNHHKLSWAMYNRDESVPIVKAFSDWIYHLAEAASKVVSLSAPKQQHVYTHVGEGDKYTCILCKSKGHRLAECTDFERMAQDDRMQFITENNVCRRCLKVHKGRCFSKRECGVDGCKSKHHSRLPANRIGLKPGSRNDDQGVVSAHQLANEAGAHYFRIIPVKLYNGDQSLEVYAFLDEGSSVTLIDQKISNKLRLKGSPDPLCLRWTNEVTRTENNSIRASMQISAIGSSRKYWLNDVHTVTNLSLPRQTINADLLQKTYRHLAGIPICSYTNVNPVILIGTNNWKLAVPRKLREGKWSEPIATKSYLGWSVQGASTKHTDALINVHSCSCDWEKLHDAVKTSFDLEAVSARTISSDEESRSIDIMERTCKKLQGKYEIGLLWKDDQVSMPNSYPSALKRAKALRSKMRCDTALNATVNERISNLLSKGYAREVTEAELLAKNNRVWYLPIFVTFNPNKPNKARLVWDAAAKTFGHSLNDFLMAGPDFLKPPNDVLMAFRVGKVAVCGDIAEMFHQINISAVDMHAQRFLWWPNSAKEAPTIYVMQAMTFGIRCTPCIAHYVRIKNAEEYKQKYPRAFEAIQQAHYVDDFIDSMNTAHEALTLAKEVHHIHAAGGFTIRNWASNSAEVVRSLQRSCDKIQAPVTLGDSEKVLGMYWDPNKDVFMYTFRFSRLKRDVFRDDFVPTKRETLQILMSIFDPLNLLAPYTINLKILLQRVWQLDCGWDEELPTMLHSGWRQWKAVLRCISGIEIPRCYSRMLTGASNIQIHTFVDASETAYAAACYLRVKCGSDVNVALIAAKSRVAPLKPLSIPRLELQAAVIGARLAQKVMNVRNLRAHHHFYWSDSKTVLRWLKMDPRGFNQYVMHRIGELIETTHASQWRWVPSKSNSADLATKIHTKINSQMWLYGPEFLQLDEDHWPTCGDLGPANQSETRKCVLHMHPISPITFFVEYYSDWRRLYRAVALWVLYLRKVNACRLKLVKPMSVTYEHIEKAKSALYKVAQKSTYESEVCLLSRGQPIERRSTLITLNTYLDNEGVLRMQGRSSSINSHDDAIILPKSHHVTFLIVKNYHEMLHHTSHETGVNLIRSKFYIPRLRVLYKTVRKSCQKCKNDTAKPDIPQMAPIPAARLASNERPFTFTGVDYFGPMWVIVGRHREKRWGVLFTCLTLRAIHLEMAHSLDTSSCIMCLRNFIARRGTPKEIFSDNGTNFKAAAKIVRDELKNVNFSVLEKKFDGIKWRFNPPSAPHMGGAWERLVRSVKTVLNKISPSEKFYDESLRSALCELEFIINARPLTFVSLDTADDGALTPNHILLGSADGEKVFCGDNVDLRTRWRQIQRFADRFWQRWVREYAPNLLRRGKWFAKRPPLRIGDVVVIVDEMLPRNSWPKGVIIDVVVAKDGQVRQATVKTQNGLMTRPTAKIAILDVGIEDGSLARGLICEGEDVAAEV